MKNKQFKFNQELFNFVINAVKEKLNTSIKQSEFENKKEFDARLAAFWGDFFEQVLGVDRDEVIKKNYTKIFEFLKKGVKLSDPTFVKCLYLMELLDVSGEVDLSFDEIYKPKKLAS